MNNARLMYLRPGNMFKEFIIEDNSQTVSSTGRVVNRHTGNGTRTLKGCLAQANEKDIASHSRPDHTVTRSEEWTAESKADRQAYSWGQTFLYL